MQILLNNQFQENMSQLYFIVRNPSHRRYKLHPTRNDLDSNFTRPHAKWKPYANHTLWHIFSFMGMIIYYFILHSLWNIQVISHTPYIPPKMQRLWYNMCDSYLILTLTTRWCHQTGEKQIIPDYIIHFLDNGTSILL